MAKRRRGGAGAHAAPAPAAKDDAKKKPKSTMRSLGETAVILVVVVVVLRGFLLESFKIPSSSMEPTLIGNTYYGDRVLAWKPSVLWCTTSRCCKDWPISASGSLTVSTLSRVMLSSPVPTA